MRRLILLAATCASVVPVANANASLGLTETTISSSTRTFRALQIDDLAGGPNAVRLGRAYGGETTHFSIDDPVAGVANVPAGCRLDTTVKEVECPFASYDTIVVNAGGGNDNVSSHLELANLQLKHLISSNRVPPLIIRLGAGNDVFYGDDDAPTSAAVLGQGGRDRIDGNDGNDLLVGGPGRDRISGGGGRNILFGGPGQDSLTGGSTGGGSFMLGGPGRDRCGITSGKDRVRSCERY